MPTSLLLLLALDPEALVATARSLTAAGDRCPVEANTTDITVCGMRRADRFRVPFIVRDAGDPRNRTVSQERQALLHRTTPLEDKSPFLVGGGMAGVSVGIGGGGSTSIRKPAP